MGVQHHLLVQITWSLSGKRVTNQEGSSGKGKKRESREIQGGKKGKGWDARGLDSPLCVGTGGGAWAWAWLGLMMGEP